MFDSLSVAATSLASLLAGLFGGGSPQQPLVPEAPVRSQAIVAAPPAGSIKGTMLMVHGGGWQGPGPTAQKGLMQQPGELFLKRGWRVVSIDYRAGADGLQDVLDAAGAELASPAGRLLCIYGESGGAHLALLAAARLTAIDCVVAAGAPTDLTAYVAEARSSGDEYRNVIADQIAKVFGTTPETLAPWEPVRVAGLIAADVLLLRQQDDRLVPREQYDRFLAAARPTTQHAEFESTPNVDTETWWLHGTLSAAGRAAHDPKLGSFVDGQVNAYRAERSALRKKCSGVTRRLGESDAVRLTRALRCLAARDSRVSRKEASRAKRSTSRRLRGQINAARVWDRLRRSVSGRRALAAVRTKRATISLRPSDATKITVRLKKRASARRR